MQTAPSPRSSAVPNPDAASDRLLADILIATERDINPEHYLAGRHAGATHAEIIAADVNGHYLPDYAAARKEGLSHHQVIELNDAGWSPFIQIKICSYGPTPSDLDEVIALHPNLNAYHRALQDGYSHKAALNRSRSAPR